MEMKSHMADGWKQIHDESTLIMDTTIILLHLASIELFINLDPFGPM
jgi:hypothetical protein